MKETLKLKGLRSHHAKLQSESDMIKLEISNKQRELNVKIKAIAEIEAEMKKLNSGNKIKISEHALLRYIERVLDMDMEALEESIVSDTTKELIDKLGGTGTYPSHNFSIVMKDYTVVTITT